MLLDELRSPLHACSIEALYGLGNITQPYFLCGLYELTDASAQARTGSIVLYKYDSDATTTGEIDGAEIEHNTNSNRNSNKKISAVTSVSCDGGVLDMKATYSATRSSVIVAAALSVGQLSLYEIPISADTSFNLAKLSTVKDEEDDSLYLSVSMSGEVDQVSSSGQKMAVSTQNGSILLFEWTPSGISLTNKGVDTHQRYGESLPAWIVAIRQRYHSSNDSDSLLVSGGDDAAMKLWDLRQGLNTPVHADGRTHQAGVTSAQWHPHDENIFATGSYDEHVRVWDVRMLKKSKPLQEIHTGGGVWRTKWHYCSESAQSYLLTASMQNGCFMYHLDSDLQSHSENVISNKDERNADHLAYGVDIIGVQNASPHTNVDDGVADIVNDSRRQQEFTFASCSFYDNLVQVWNDRC